MRNVATRRPRKSKTERRQAIELRHLQSLLDRLSADCSAWEEMDQYEEFLAKLAESYDLENPEAVYEQWMDLPERTTEQFAAMLRTAEQAERNQSRTP